MAFTYTWDATFEGLPTDGENISQGAQRIRDLKVAVRERLEVEHDFEASGKHIAGKCTILQEDTAANLDLVEGGLGYATDEKKLYKGTASGKEAFDFGANVFPSGTKMLFYQDTAPTGWSIVDTVNDKLVYISKGSAAGGEAGGAELSSGSWTISGLSGSTTIDSAGDHKHLSPLPYYDTSDGCAPQGRDAPWGHGTEEGVGSTDIDKTGSTDVSSTNYKYTSTAGAHTHSATTSVSHDGSWRPAAVVCIIAEKD